MEAHFIRKLGHLKTRMEKEAAQDAPALIEDRSADRQIAPDGDRDTSQSGSDR